VWLMGSTTFLRLARGIEGRRRSQPVARGSGNVFRDFGRKNADIEQLKAILAAEIIKALDEEDLGLYGAQARTGVAAADFSRIRNADLGRFTVDSPDVDHQPAGLKGRGQSQSTTDRNCRARGHGAH